LADRIAIRQRALIACGRRNLFPRSPIWSDAGHSPARRRTPLMARNRDIELRTAEQLRALTPSGHGWSVRN